MSTYFMIQNPLQIETVILKWRSYLQNSLFFEERNTCPRQTVILKFYLNVLAQSKFLKIILYLLDYFLLTQKRQFRELEFIVIQNFMS
jgi:hypothetical protein